MKTETRKFSSNFKAISLLALVALVPAIAQAHPGHVHANGFSSGISHPLSGWDHILAMVAVGLWAAQIGGRALWAMPAAFISLMTAGGVLGMMGFHLPMVETGIMLSVVALGLLIVAAARLPLIASMGIVGLFALFHGFAHGTEIPVAASGMTYSLGFIAGTALLHACGVGMGLLAQKSFKAPAVRIAGAIIAVQGLCLFLG